MLHSIALYAALTGVAPMLLQRPDGHALASAILQVQAAAATMACMPPGHVGMLIFLLPILLGITQQMVAPFEFEAHHLASWGGALAVLLVLLPGWRWLRLLRGGIPSTRSRAPSPIHLSRNLGTAQGDLLSNATPLRNRLTRMVSRGDMRATGTQKLARSLRALLLFAATIGDNGGAQLPRYRLNRAGFSLDHWVFVLFSLIVAMSAVELLLAIGGLVAKAPGFVWPIEVTMLAVTLACLRAMARGIFGSRPLSGFGKGLLMRLMFVRLNPPLCWHKWSALTATKADAALGVS